MTSYTPHKIHVLKTFSDGSFDYQVSDHFYETSPQYNTRDLAFKNENMPCFYLHSSVYLDERISSQPIYVIPQVIFNLWNSVYDIQHALVLGCAGCTIPRFLILQYPMCTVDGVELSPQMCKIAREYFFLPIFKNRFSLICEDAFSFFKQRTDREPYDLIFTDLFHGNAFIDKVFSVSFLTEQFTHMAQQSLLLINLLDISPQKASAYQQQAKRVFNNVRLLIHGSHTFMLLAKAAGHQWDSFIAQVGQKYEHGLV